MNRLLVCMTVLIPALTASAGTTIDQLAPENTVIVIGVDDFSDSMERGKHHPLLSPWISLTRSGDDGSAGLGQSPNRQRSDGRRHKP